MGLAWEVASSSLDGSGLRLLEWVLEESYKPLHGPLLWPALGRVLDSYPWRFVPRTRKNYKSWGNWLRELCFSKSRKSVATVPYGTVTVPCGTVTVPCGTVTVPYGTVTVPILYFWSYVSYTLP